MTLLIQLLSMCCGIIFLTIKTVLYLWLSLRAMIWLWCGFYGFLKPISNLELGYLYISNHQRNTDTVRKLQFNSPQTSGIVSSFGTSWFVFFLLSQYILIPTRRNTVVSSLFTESKFLWILFVWFNWLSN